MSQSYTCPCCSHEWTGDAPCPKCGQSMIPWSDLDRCRCLHWMGEHHPVDGCLYCHCEKYDRRGDHMPVIQYVTGDATVPGGDGPKVIAHVCNDIGAWGAGFVLALSKRWREPERRYRAWCAGTDPFSLRMVLGGVQLVPVTPDLAVANIVAQHGISGINGEPPIRYDSLRDGLRWLAKNGAWATTRGLAGPRFSVHMPRIGCGLAGGRWEVVGKIVQDELCGNGIAVTVYDLST